MLLRYNPCRVTLGMLVRCGLLLANLCLLSRPTSAAIPYDIPPLNPSSPNYANVFAGVKIGNTTPEPDTFKAGDEILSAVYAYLCPNSPVYNNVQYRDRLFVLLDHRLGIWATNTGLSDIGHTWQASYAYMLMKHYRPAELSGSRITTYESGIRNNNANILGGNPLLYNSGVLANLWLNGDLRLAMGVYFGAVALGDSAQQTTAQNAINNVMTKTVLQDGGMHYVGFWTETANYHEENIFCMIFWWKITGSTAVKTALDQSLHYIPLANEPSGFVEQSSNIAYKHMYNNNHNVNAALWKAYLYNDGYNYYFGKPQETVSSTEILNSVLYQSGRVTKTPSSNIGVIWDGNNQGPRGRFNGTWGWVANGRDVQRGGPENLSTIQSQGYAGRMGGKNTFVGAFTLGAVANKTSLKGALDGVAVEFKSSTGTETDFMRGTKYRFLSQDENTATITRKNFGTLSTSYRLSTRTSASATTDWGAGTAWLGQQVWVLTGERMIGLVQIVSDASSTVYGLDARLIYCGGRPNIMGSYLDLTQPDSTSFAFGDLSTKIHAKTFNGASTSQRIGIYDPASTDNYSVLLRLNDSAVSGDAALTFPAGTRRWVVVDTVRNGTGFATSVTNVLAENSTWAVLQFTEGTRKIRIVQNLTNAAHSYSGNFVVGSTYSSASLHRSWNSTVTPLTISSGTAVVADTVPAYGHMIAVNSNQPDDHNNSVRTYSTAFP